MLYSDSLLPNSTCIFIIMIYHYYFSNLIIVIFINNIIRIVINTRDSVSYLVVVVEHTDVMISLVCIACIT